MHFDTASMDDAVLLVNALTSEGREKVASQYSLLSSIEGADAREWIVGTRYHAGDLYADLLDMKVELFDDEGSVIESNALYEVFERQLEDVGDGTGQYL